MVIRPLRLSRAAFDDPKLEPKPAGGKVSVSPIIIDDKAAIYFWDNAVPDGDLPAVVGEVPSDELITA